MRVRQTSRTLSRIYDENLRRAGLQISQLTVLVAVARFGEAGAGMGKMAQVLGMDRTTLTPNPLPLEKAGLLRVARHPADARAGRSKRSHMTTRTQLNEAQSSSTPKYERRSYVPLFAAAALGALACNKANAYVRPPVPVRTRTVWAFPQAHQELRFSGTVVPEAEIELSFKVGGYATSLLTVRDKIGRASCRDRGR